MIGQAADLLIIYAPKYITYRRDTFGLGLPLDEQGAAGVRFASAVRGGRLHLDGGLVEKGRKLCTYAYG